jgi:hypothetical protein
MRSEKGTDDCEPKNSLIPVRGLTDGRRQALDVDENQCRFKSLP